MAISSVVRTWQYVTSCFLQNKRLNSLSQRLAKFLSAVLGAIACVVSILWQYRPRVDIELRLFTDRELPEWPRVFVRALAAILSRSKAFFRDVFDIRVSLNLWKSAVLC